MPIGYDFVCENEKCKAFKKQLTLAGPWPLVEIDQLLQLDSIKADHEMTTGLEARKKEGRKLACAIMPNKANLKYQGARVQMFCPTDKVIWDIDFDYWDYRSKIPTEECRCYRCKGKMVTAESAKENGLSCPHCEKTMTAKMWFTNE